VLFYDILNKNLSLEIERRHLEFEIVKTVKLLIRLEVHLQASYDVGCLDILPSRQQVFEILLRNLGEDLRLNRGFRRQIEYLVFIILEVSDETDHSLNEGFYFILTKLEVAKALCLGLGLPFPELQVCSQNDLSLIEHSELPLALDPISQAHALRQWLDGAELFEFRDLIEVGHDEGALFLISFHQVVLKQGHVVLDQLHSGV
jgi:hypothetical protein